MSEWNFRNKSSFNNNNHWQIEMDKFYPSLAKFVHFNLTVLVERTNSSCNNKYVYESYEKQHLNEAFYHKKQKRKEWTPANRQALYLLHFIFILSYFMQILIAYFATGQRRKKNTPSHNIVRNCWNFNEICNFCQKLCKRNLEIWFAVNKCELNECDIWYLVETILCKIGGE
jgi:hypothetical protein